MKQSSTCFKTFHAKRYFNSNIFVKHTTRTIQQGIRCIIAKCLCVITMYVLRNHRMLCEKCTRRTSV